MCCILGHHSWTPFFFAFVWPDLIYSRLYLSFLRQLFASVLHCRALAVFSFVYASSAAILQSCVYFVHFLLSFFVWIFLFLTSEITNHLNYSQSQVNTKHIYILTEPCNPISFFPVYVWCFVLSLCCDAGAQWKT